MGGNYPPGTSASDPRAPWNAPDMSHEHEWRPVEDGPIFEDGAAIFREECVWEKVLDAERGYEGERVVTESIPCEETRHVRFEASYIWYPSGQGAPVDSLWSDGPLPVEMEHALMQIERAANEGDVDEMYVDPDDESGEVRVEWEGWTLVYKP